MSLQPTGPWLSGTRGRILGQLCAERSTVAQLAESVQVTRNAVRAHLNRLERDGLVRHERVRGQVGKPAHIYELTPDGEGLLSRGYPVVLDAILEAVESLDESTGERMLNIAARALAARCGRPGGDVRSRSEGAAEALRELGGVAVVREDEGGFIIRGDCCPLRASSTDHPIACRLMEILLADLIRVPVRENCDRSGPPHCNFLIDTTPRQ
ncbi:MAG TPA: helix-turn-helix domain-containing protein [Longimicrobiales bacterium]|nr:helix-turn-helix domain-containing protein [Longimicrobiales bacterium]